MNDIELKAEFSTRLKRIRKRKGLTQEKLAELLGTDYRIVGLWERPHLSQTYLPSFQNLRRLCQTFDVKPEYFLCLDYGLGDPEWD